MPWWPLCSPGALLARQDIRGRGKSQVRSQEDTSASSSSLCHNSRRPIIILSRDSRIPISIMILPLFWSTPWAPWWPQAWWGAVVRTAQTSQTSSWGNWELCERLREAACHVTSRVSRDVVKMAWHVTWLAGSGVTRLVSFRKVGQEKVTKSKYCDNCTNHRMCIFYERRR